MIAIITGVFLVTLTVVGMYVFRYEIAGQKRPDPPVNRHITGNYGEDSVGDPNADEHYNAGWADAIDAAIKIVNEARLDGGTDLREIRERIRGLKEMAG